MRRGAMATDVRAEVLYSGEVQGVGFRYAATRAAANYNVAGYVQNIPGGQVRIVAEGSRNEIEAFLDDVRDSMGVYIANQVVRWGAVTGEFQGFRVHF